MRKMLLFKNFQTFCIVESSFKSTFHANKVFPLKLWGRKLGNFAHMKKKHIHVIQIHSLSAHSQLWKWKIQFRISFSPLFVRNLCKPDEHYTQSFQLLLYLLFMTMIFWKIAINFTKNCQIINHFCFDEITVHVVENSSVSMLSTVW